MANFPGLGRYAQLGSIMAARANNVAAQNQNQDPRSYINPTVPSSFAPVQGPENAIEAYGSADLQPDVSREYQGSDTLKAGQAPELPKSPESITLPPMPASSSLRDVSPRQPSGNMASFIANQNSKYRSVV